ncbi:MAG: phosphoesterase PA-phosphatase, partial [Clostridia bacterium]
MKRKIKINFIITGTLFLLFILFTIAVVKIDVKPIGPDGSQIGLSTLNKLVFDFFGVSSAWNIVTDILAVISCLVALFFAIIGLVQLIKFKSIKKVDYRIVLLGAFYLVVVFCILLFELIVVNYRPIIINDGLGSAYPSTHTLMVLCIMITAIFQFKYLINNKAVLIVVDTVSCVIVVVTIIGRLISGVHWFT